MARSGWDDFKPEPTVPKTQNKAAPATYESAKAKVIAALKKGLAEYNGGAEGSVKPRFVIFGRGDKAYVTLKYNTVCLFTSGDPDKSNSKTGLYYKAVSRKKLAEAIEFMISEVEADTYEKELTKALATTIKKLADARKKRKPKAKVK